VDKQTRLLAAATAKWQQFFSACFCQYSVLFFYIAIVEPDSKIAPLLLLTLAGLQLHGLVNAAVTIQRPTVNPAQAWIPENSIAGTIVNIAETDGPANKIRTNGGGTKTWALTAPSCNSYFQLQVDASTDDAYLVVLNPPDFETIKSCTAAVAITEGGTTVTQDLSITINNTFDVTPGLAPASYSCSFAEEQAADTLLPSGCQATYTDSEADLVAPYAADTISCSLSGTHAAYFSVQHTVSSKLCAPKANSKFDRDHIPTSLPAGTLNFDINVIDAGGNKVSRPVTVTVTDINDNTPACSVSPIALTVSETFIGDILGSMSCSDIDSGVNAQITYSLMDPASSRYFSVDSTTGRLSTIAELDYDVASTSNYTTVTIKVADSGTPTALTTSVTVSIAITPVNDNTPAWGTFSPTDPATATTPIGSVSENADAGVVVFTANAIDADKGSDGTITYSIQSAKGSDLSNLMTAFKINSATGVVSINTKGILDRETITYADITVLAQDNPTTSSPLTITRAIRVTIDDYNEIPPAFVPASGIYPTVTVAEGLASGSAVVALSVTDPDASNTAITCSIIGGNTGSVFKMNAGNPKQIDVNIAIEPDKPTSQATSYVLAVACADSGSPTALTSTATVSISVSLTNDNVPTANFPSGTNIVIPENQAVGDITTIVPNDNDAGADGTFTCSLSPAGSPFSVSAACDKLVMTSLVDRETIASYPMILTIKDDGSPASSSTVSFTVSLSDINDNYPVCTPSTYLASFAETSPAISPLVTVTCSDADTFGISYYSNTTYFTVDSNTGVVSYTGGADYDTGVSSYKVVVYAVDKNDANQYATANVYVTVTNVNEFTPTFTTKTVSVPEPRYGGQLVTSFVASDADASPDNVKSYRITSGDSSGYFSINNAGDIYVTPGRTLDYEALSAAGLTSFILTIEAADGASTPLTGTGSLTISVTDINDNTPIFTQSTYTGTVTEGTATVATVTTVAATDADITAAFKTIQYSFSPTNTYFTVDPTSGVVSKTAADLKYDSFQTVSIPVLAIDNSGAGPNTATATVVISVTSVNVAPTCTVTVLTPTVQEDMALGTQLLSMTSPTTHCSDSNSLQTLSYSLSADSDNHFAIHPSTGALVLSKNLDFENTSNHYMTVLVKDNGSPVMSATIVVTVSVTDVNEYAPVCTSPTSASIPEDSAVSAAVYSVTGCADSDKTVTTFNYAINSGVPFAVSTAGAVTLSSAVDYETPPTSYVVEIAISDTAPSLGGFKTTTYTTTVTILPVNDNNPAFTSPTTLYSDVAESSGTAVGTAITLTTGSGGSGSTVSIAATDADKGNSSHYTIVYAIASGDTHGWFSINPNTGVISTAQQLDREQLSTLTLTVTARDMAGLAATVSTNVIITVTDENDNAPVFPTKHLTINVTEGNTPPNTLFDFSSATMLTDADVGANANLNLAIQSGVMAAPNEEFEISGKILRTKKTFSLATDGPQYILVLTATDGGLPTLTGTATVTVNIVEANLVTPTFAVGSYTMSVPETTAVGASLYNASATDADHGLSGTVSYGLSSVSPVASYFAVDNKTGNVFLQNAIDYDTATSKVFELYIVAYDKGTPPRSNTFTLTVSITDANDNDPQFNTTNSFSKSIAENVGTGFVVNNIVTYDVDTGLGGNVTCSIASQSSPAIFAISTYSCVMTTTANPDREALAVHTVTVKLTDLGTPARTNQALFTITLTDLNDNTPTFSFAQMVTSVPENSAIGAAVTTVYATDADTGTNGAIAYSMISNDGAGDHGNFSISATTGAITVAQTLDREQKAMYSLRVLATDSGSPPLTGTCVVNVTITDINDNTPTWVSAPYTASVSESAPLGELVITVSATDRDSTFGVLTYSIASGDTLGLFRINSATGRIETAKSSGLDRESVGLWNLTLVVNDNGSPPLSATTSLTVTVTDVNEFAPAWVNSSYNFRIIENSPVSTLVGNVRATDNDAGPVNNVIYYAIDAYLLGDNYFSISSTTGDISVSTAALDRETRDTYQLRVVAWDGATPSKTATNCLTVTIYIDDANDHDPVYSKSYYNATVKEDVSIGYNVLTVSGSDLDTGNNAVLIYRINTTDTAGAFASYFFNLDSSTGLLSVQRSLDRENSSYFHFPILIYDNGTAPQRSGSASVYIIVEDVNDNAPSLASFYNAEVPEVDDGNMKIATITATDPDTGSGGSVSYYWNSNTPYFNIDATTGIITRNTLNSVEEYKIYTQDVVARDSGSPQLTSSASKVRIDTFPADEYIVLIHFSMSEADYLSRLSTIKTNLAKTLVGKYPNNRVGHWKYHSHNGNIVGYFYALANTDTDSISYITVDKKFVPYSDLLAFWRFDSSGTPTDILKGSDFTNTQIVKVEPYPQTASTPWYEEWWGILLLVLAGLAAAALLAAAIYGLVFCAKAGCGAQTPSAPASQPAKPPPPIKERQILELNQDKHPRHHPKPKGRYLIKENQGQNKGVQETSNNRTTTPKAEFDKPQQQQNSTYDNGRASPVGSLGGDGALDF
ncbi:hypothetical protein BOX15_Mlig014302g3, partial [Macrostomum lignano]